MSSMFSQCLVPTKYLRNAITIIIIIVMAPLHNQLHLRPDIPHCEVKY